MMKHKFKVGRFHIKHVDPEVRIIISFKLSKIVRIYHSSLRIFLHEKLMI